MGTLCQFRIVLRHLVEGHVPKGVEVQVLSSAQVYRMKNPRFGDFLLQQTLKIFSFGFSVQTVHYIGGSYGDKCKTSGFLHH